MEDSRHAQHFFQPTQAIIDTANLTSWLSKYHCKSVADFHRWSASHPSEFWQAIIDTLNIRFTKTPSTILDLANGTEHPRWLLGAKLNIAESCLAAPPNQRALIYLRDNQLEEMTYGELDSLSNRVANGLLAAGLKATDKIAVAMPMTKEAVAIFLGIIKIGGVVVSIADSFSSQEMKSRLDIAKTTVIFTQDFIVRNQKTHALYERVKETNIQKIIVISLDETKNTTLRREDIAWESFLSDKKTFHPVACDPMDTTTVLFSSGTTANPKAICWDHTTAIKSASDAYFHQNIKQNDVLCWPTNLGWMMGPWLIYAALINRAAIALYTDLPTHADFGKFIQEAEVTMLGVVPTLVANWRESRCMEKYDWSHIKVFSSTGECSNVDDMTYLMHLGKNKPIIEYCGGTEIGGAYLSSTVIQKNYPALFSTPTMGTAITIIDENGLEADKGEVAIIPPAIGLSTRLLNADHHDIYFAGMPILKNKILRRHGDEIIRYSSGYYAILGRVDDAMNLGGIKISAAEIERAVSGCTNILETAAVAISPQNGGASQLIIFAVSDNTQDKNKLMKEMQNKINVVLNPLFKINDVVLLSALPKTASNKIMRRTLRKEYQENFKSFK